MLKLQEFIAESADEKKDVSEHRSVVIAPGRYCPPTRGHKTVIDTLVKLGEQLDAEPVIIIVDSGKRSNKNPISGEVRQRYLQEMFPGIRMVIAHNPYAAVETLNKEHGLIPVGGVTGADRADSYKQMVGRIFGNEIKEKYLAEVLTRDPDADKDIAGITATKARDAAMEGDEGSFRAMTGLGHDDAVELMSLLKEGMES